MSELEGALARLEQLFAEVEALDDDARATVFELLDGVDLVHRVALVSLARRLGSDTLTAHGDDPAIAWLIGAYRLDADDEVAEAEAALDAVRPYVHSHGGDVEVLDVTAGVVRVRMSGACAGCTASAITLQQGVEEALRDGFGGYVGLEVAEDDAAAHPPPGGTLAPTLVQIQPRPA